MLKRVNVASNLSTMQAGASAEIVTRAGSFPSTSEGCKSSSNCRTLSLIGLKNKANYFAQAAASIQKVRRD
jgi:hypothetical protein